MSELGDMGVDEARKCGDVCGVIHVCALVKGHSGKHRNKSGDTAWEYTLKLPALRPVEEMDWERCKHCGEPICLIRGSQTEYMHEFVTSSCERAEPTPSEPDTAGGAECAGGTCPKCGYICVGIGVSFCPNDGSALTPRKAAGTRPNGCGDCPDDDGPCGCYPDRAAGQGASGDDRSNPEQILRYVMDGDEPSAGTGWLIEKGQLALGSVENKPAWVSYLHPGVFRFARERDAVGMLWALRSYGDDGFRGCYVSEHRWGFDDSVPQPSLPPVEGSDGFEQKWESYIKGAESSFTPEDEELARCFWKAALRARPTVEEVGGKDEHRDEGLIREIGEEEHALRSKLAKACTPYELSSMARTSLQRTKVLEAEVAGKDAEIAAQIQTIREYQESGIALGAECCALRAELATKDAEIARLNMHFNAGLESERRDCSKALLAVSSARVCTPVEGYGTNSSWAIDDLCKAVNTLRAELATLKARGGGEDGLPSLPERWNPSEDSIGSYMKVMPNGEFVRWHHYNHLRARLISALSTSPQDPVQVVPEDVVDAATQVKRMGRGFAAPRHAHTLADWALSLLQGNQPQTEQEVKS